MFAPTIAAPSSSVIKPRSVPRACWAATSAAVNMINRPRPQIWRGRFLREFIVQPQENRDKYPKVVVIARNPELLSTDYADCYLNLRNLWMALLLRLAD